MEAGLDISRKECESSFDDEVGQPAQEQMQPVAAAARRACVAPTPVGWRTGKAGVVRALVDANDDVLPPRRRPDISAVVGSTLGVRADVYCWQPAAWAPFSEQYAIVRGGEETSLEGIADRARHRIDLDPGICTGLRWYLRRLRPAPLSYENFELAHALVVLTHQAEHLQAPATPELAVECDALQRVRPLVRERGWDAGYAAELASQAWELGYQRLPPEARSPACRDGGRLDRHPQTTTWP